MRKVFLPFAQPSIDEEEIEEVKDALKSGWVTTGPKTKRLEKKFKQLIGARYAVAVNSCTAGLHLALEAIGLEENDEVIVPTVTFASTAEVVEYFDAKPVLVDVDPDTLLIDVDKIKEKINQKTKAIIPVHFGGQACDIDKILKIAKENDLRVIWDAAHSLPTKYKGEMIGTFPDITAFSFYATKTITTGEGGMITTDNKKWAKKMRILSLHGITKDAWKRYDETGSWYYEIKEAGYKYNLPDIAAALGLAQLKKIEKFLQKRKHIAQRYNKAFQKIEEITPLARNENSTHCWHLYVIKLDLEKLRIDRSEFIEKMKEKNIGTSVHFIPLHMHPFYKEKYGYQKKDFPNAFNAYKQIVSLPIYPKMSEKDTEDVIETIKEIVKQYKK